MKYTLLSMIGALAAAVCLSAPAQAIPGLTDRPYPNVPPQNQCIVGCSGDAATGQGWVAIFAEGIPDSTINFTFDPQGSRSLAFKVNCIQRTLNQLCPVIQGTYCHDFVIVGIGATFGSFTVERPVGCAWGDAVTSGLTQ